MAAPAMVDFISGTVLSASFLPQILYFASHFKRRYKDSISSGALQCAKIIAIEPFLAVYAFSKSSGPCSHFAADDFAIALFALLATFGLVTVFSLVQKH